ncbi:hypothetical protein PROFUN_06704 [Planoprotostelium fungivorum]|uniref:AB hydrolase-1 domain-containing protein n=1 Tax=Planoprotostelium fungivorum TaxID=1890364 RepID=A0A2P6NG36_9EUKA|nr:hypothetical protein PROFUN_06704 [Planoprotostelium fungivorum]
MDELKYHPGVLFGIIASVCITYSGTNWSLSLDESLQSAHERWKTLLFLSIPIAAINAYIIYQSHGHHPINLLQRSSISCTRFTCHLTVILFVLMSYQYYEETNDITLHPPPGILYHFTVEPPPPSPPYTVRMHLNCTHGSHQELDTDGATRAAHPDTCETSKNHVNELHHLLNSAGIPPPYIYVGWSYGGLVGQAYDLYHPGDIKGLIMIDTMTSEDYDSRNLEDGIRAGKIAFNLLRFLSPFGVSRLLASVLPFEAGFPPQSVTTESIISTTSSSHFPNTAYRELCALNHSLDRMKTLESEKKKSKADVVFLASDDYWKGGGHQKLRHVTSMTEGNVQLIRLPDGTDHYVPFRQPSQIIRAINSLLHYHSDVQREE